MERYKRQVNLIGEDSQAKLKNAEVLIIGAGGIGNICAKFLASSGVGYVEIWDNDDVELSNLNRQILFNSGSLGLSKAEALANTIRKINPDIECEGITAMFEAPFGLEDVDVVLDCTDNMKSSYYIEEQALKYNVPLVFAKTSKWFGTVTVIKDKQYLQQNYPTKQLNKDGSVIPAIGGVIGSFQANLALKLITGMKVSDKVFHFDILNDRFTEYEK